MSSDEGYTSFESTHTLDSSNTSSSNSGCQNNPTCSPTSNFQNFIKTQPELTSKQSEKILKSHYHLTKIIHESSSARLYSGIDKTTLQKVIVKRMLKSKSSDLEIYLTKKAHHICPEATLPILFDIADNKYYTYVQPEYGCSLYDFMAKRQQVLNIAECKFIYKQLLTCMHKLQKHSIFHLDIKEENILIDPKSYQIKLIDFGVSRINPITQQKLIGSAEFFAPEILLGLSSTSSVKLHDVWSVAVSIFSSLTGQVPYKNLKHLINGQERINMSMLSDVLNDELVEIFSKTFVLNYKNRSNFKELLACKFFQ